mmetsp:Transcript_10687/g.30477  ORF Transcript_10687/g.30477 Transcript_10687/m.30477 type:complete len:253 (+) Transcript_10687:331-1089(+)
MELLPPLQGGALVQGELEPERLGLHGQAGADGAQQVVQRFGFADAPVGQVCTDAKGQGPERRPGEVHLPKRRHVAGQALRHYPGGARQAAERHGHVLNRDRPMVYVQMGQHDQVGQGQPVECDDPGGVGGLHDGDAAAVAHSTGVATVGRPASGGLHPRLQVPRRDPDLRRHPRLVPRARLAVGGVVPRHRGPDLPPPEPAGLLPDLGVVRRDPITDRLRPALNAVCHGPALVGATKHHGHAGQRHLARQRR